MPYYEEKFAKWNQDPTVSHVIFYGHTEEERNRFVQYIMKYLQYFNKFESTLENLEEAMMRCEHFPDSLFKFTINHAENDSERIFANNNISMTYNIDKNVYVFKKIKRILNENNNNN